MPHSPTPEPSTSTANPDPDQLAATSDHAKQQAKEVNKEMDEILQKQSKILSQPPEQPIQPSSPPPNEQAQSNDPPQVSEAKQEVETVQSMQEQAKQQATEALSQVKQIEEQEKSHHDELKQQIEQTKKQVEDAKSQVQQAHTKNQDSQKKVEEILEKSGGKNAGVSPVDLALAPFKVPPPAKEPEIQLDKSTQEELKTKKEETQKQLEQTQKQIEKAEKQIGKTLKISDKAHKQHESIFNKLKSLAQTMSGKSDKSQKEPQPYLMFLMTGGITFILSILVWIFAKNIIWTLIAIAAIMEVGFGLRLKSRS